MSIYSIQFMKKAAYGLDKRKYFDFYKGVVGKKAIGRGYMYMCALHHSMSLLDHRPKNLIFVTLHKDIDDTIRQHVNLNLAYMRGLTPLEVYERYILSSSEYGILVNAMILIYNKLHSIDTNQISLYKKEKLPTLTYHQITDIPIHVKYADARKIHDMKKLLISREAEDISTMNMIINNIPDVNDFI